MIYYLKLVRPLNLVVLALTMILFRYCLADVASYELYQFKSYLSSAGFWSLLITTLLVAASGYVINDIFDVETDQINKPEKVIVGTHLTDNAAFNFYKLLCFLSVVGAGALAYFGGNTKFASIPFMVLVLLYLYAQNFKSMALVGNIIIGICAALPVLLIAMYDFKINEYDSNVVVMLTRGIGLSAVFYAVFAFLTTVIREIIKDMEDKEGDESTGSRTLPIVLGVKASKWVVLLFQILTVALLSIVSVYFYTIHLPVFMMVSIVVLIVPVLIQSIVMFRAKSSKDFKLAGNIGKVHMLLGVLSMLYFYSGSGPFFFDQLTNYVVYLLG